MPFIDIVLDKPPRGANPYVDIYIPPHDPDVGYKIKGGYHLDMPGVYEFCGGSVIAECSGAAADRKIVVQQNMHLGGPIYKPVFTFYGTAIPAGQTYSLYISKVGVLSGVVTTVDGDHMQLTEGQILSDDDYILCGLSNFQAADTISELLRFKYLNRFLDMRPTGNAKDDY